MKIQLIRNDIAFACSACQKEVKDYYVVPFTIKDDEDTIVLHKLCINCFNHEFKNGAS